MRQQIIQRTLPQPGNAMTGRTADKKLKRRLILLSWRRERVPGAARHLL
ncbi:hypothetical protein [Nocardia sp. NPDC051570]